MGQDHGQPSPLCSTEVGNPAPELRFWCRGTKWYHGCTSTANWRCDFSTRRGISARCQLTSVTISTPEGALHRLQHPLATRDSGMCPVTSLEVEQLQPDYRGCAVILAVTTTFNVECKSIPDHAPFSFLPPLFILFMHVLLCLPWSYSC